MSETKHTPLPWRVSADDKYVVCPTWSPRFAICTTSDEQDRTEADSVNAAFIVRACNNFDALLDACKMALGAFERNDCIDWNVLAQAIAAAEREEDGNEK